MTERGRYSVLEGSDYVGKTTQLKLAKEFAEEHGIETHFIREPGGTPLGGKLREIILHGEDDMDPMTEFLLFIADRNHAWHSTINPTLEKGINVISDRNWISTVMYQGHGGGQISAERLAKISHDILHPNYMRPDILAVLSLTRATWLQRKCGRLEVEAADTIERRESEYFERVYSGYQNVKDIAPYAHIVDAEADPEEVFSRLRPLFFPEYS